MRPIHPRPVTKENTTPVSTRSLDLPDTLKKHPAHTLSIAAVLWVLLYANLIPMADLVVHVLGLQRDTALGEAVHFFAYDAPKVLLLLVAVVFLMGVLHTWFSPERTRAFLAKRSRAVAHMMAAGLGAVTPFCSCSAVPLFMGFVQAGIPLGVTLTFLIAAPLVSEIAMVLMLGLLGWKITLLYAGTGMTLAVVAGYVIGRTRPERGLEEWILNLPSTHAEYQATHLTWGDRLAAGARNVKEVLGRVGLYVIVAIGLGALLHGYVPEAFFSTMLGRESWWAVPAAVMMGVPLYTNAAGVIPVVQALLTKGVALGTALAFMMSVIALSFPEMILLRKVMKPRLLATFVGVVATGISLVGFLFNLILR